MMDARGPAEKPSAWNATIGSNNTRTTEGAAMPKEETASAPEAGAHDKQMEPRKRHKKQRTWCAVFPNVNEAEARRMLGFIVDETGYCGWVQVVMSE